MVERMMERIRKAMLMEWPVVYFGLCIMVR